MTTTSTSVIVFAAHADDETLGCGGAIARHVAKGDRVHVVLFGEGVMGRARSAGEGRQDPGLAHAQRVVNEDARNAIVDVLGARLTLHALPDNRFDSVALLDIVKLVEDAKSATAADVVYTHHPGDLNVDHRMVFEAVMAAFRPLPGERCSELLCFEVPSATSFAAGVVGGAFMPTVYVDVTDYLDAKIRAMECYTTERREWPHPRSSRALRALAELRGAEVGMDAAEAFQLVRAVRR